MFYKSKKIRKLYKSVYAAGIAGFVFFIIGGIVLLMDMKESLNLAVGGMIGGAGLVMLGVSIAQLMASAKIESKSGITLKQIDEEAAKDAKWIEDSKVLITEHYLVGFLSDVGYMRFNQSAFMIDDIKKIFGVKIKDNRFTASAGDDNFQDKPFGLNFDKYRIMVMTKDGEKNMLSETVGRKNERAKALDDLKTIHEYLKAVNPEIELEFETED